jgi:hypothetical protein
VNSVEGRLKRIAREEAIKNAWLIQGKEFDVMNDRIEITGKPRFINKIRPRKAVHSIDSPSEAIHGEGSEENEAKSENKSVKGTKERRFRNALNEWALRLLGSFVALIIFILFGVAIFLAYWLLNNDHDILGGALIIFIGVVGFAIYAKLQEEH